MISIHAPARGATGKTLDQYLKLIFQSTLPRGERRQEFCIKKPEDHISIHAPARGATVIDLKCFSGQSISIHAPARGATPPCAFFRIRIQISIHAPARGATNDAYKDVGGTMISIHAPARGATPWLFAFLLFHQFQSTLPRGERQISIEEMQRLDLFQSTLPRGERPSLLVNEIRSICISIHAPARGATHVDGVNGNVDIFQSTLPRGERHAEYQELSDQIKFQSTLPRGERPRPNPFKLPAFPISIHAPARGATAIYDAYSAGKTISIHAPARGATGTGCL